MDPKYKSEVLLQRGAEALAKEKVPLRLVAGRSESINQHFVRFRLVTGPILFI